MAVYRKEILENYQNPKNRGVLPGANRRAKEESPLCGCTDWVELFLRVEDDKIKEIKFQGEGCVISIASASILTEQVKGKTLSEASQISEDMIRQNFGGDLTSFRETCAFLPLQALRTALKLNGKKDRSD